MASRMNYAQYSIDQLCLSQNLTEEEKIALKNIISKVQLFEKGMHLYRRTEKMNYLYIVYSGYCKDYWIDQNGNEYIHNFYFPGDLLAIESLPQKKYSLSAIALTQTKLWAIPLEPFFELMAQTPNLLRRFVYIVSQKMHNDMYFLKTTNAKRRVADFLINIMHRLGQAHTPTGYLHLPMTQFEISNFLGMAYETVSRTLHQFQDQSIIEIDHKEIRVLDMDKLQSIGSSVEVVSYQ